MRIRELTGESVIQTNSLNDETDNGLSFFIEFDERKILFDIGQSDLFFENAEKMGIDLSQVDYLILTHSHFDPNGGLNHFLKKNKKAKIFLHINAANKFYTRIFDLIACYVDLFQKSIAQKSRIYFIDEDTQIEDNIILLEGFQEVFPQPEAIKAFYEKTHNQFIIDKFNHELVMLLIENNEIVLFSGCLHSGIINTIEEVKLFSNTMRIKATFDGFNINNPITKKNESQDYFKELTEVPGETDPAFCILHSTGEKNFLYIKGRMDRKIQTMTTGQVFEV
jgi:7,8-dihydropterin-6-yl-methyl-4-(beta-D-ribofuranosyl)aminobenzene 5'-phosphate synthase